VSQEGARTVVIGLGNPFMSDEGIGVRVLQALQSEPLPGVEFLELGTGGLSVMHALDGRAKAVIVDCAFMEMAPGALRRFGPEEVRSKKAADGLSLHESDLLAVLEVARRYGEAPKAIVLFGIQPERVAPGEALSPTLASRLPEYVQAVRKELTQRATNAIDGSTGEGGQC